MSRARSHTYVAWQTAAANENGGGCLSVYVLPLLAVFVIAGFLTLLALNTPTLTAAVPPAQSGNLNSGEQATPAAASANNSSASSAISPVFTQEVQHWGDDIVRWATAAGVDPNLAAAVMQIESCGDPRAISRSGATGLFQVMPFHFHLGENPFNPETNALRGMNYLSRSLAAGNGNPRLALAGYNGGIGVISRSEASWPAETKRYVYYGAPIYEDARSGAASSPMLQEWYGKYGAGLCNQAHNRLGLP